MHWSLSGVYDLKKLHHIFVGDWDSNVVAAIKNLCTGIPDKYDGVMINGCGNTDPNNYQSVISVAGCHLIPSILSSLEN